MAPDLRRSLYDEVLLSLAGRWEDRAERMDAGQLAGIASGVVSATWRLAAHDLKQMVELARHSELGEGEADASDV